MCQIVVITGYAVEIIMLEQRCVSGCCDDWIQTGDNIVSAAVVVRLESISFELRCVSEFCDDCLQAGEYKV